MARKFHAAATRGEMLGLNGDEMAFYDALATNEAAVRELGDETLKTLLKRYKYPPDKELEAIELIMKQAEVLSNSWTN